MKGATYKDNLLEAMVNDCKVITRIPTLGRKIKASKILRINKLAKLHTIAHKGSAKGYKLKQKRGE